MSPQNKAYLYAALAILFWSTVPTAFKIALTQLSFPELVFYASLSSLTVLGIALGVKGKLREVLGFSAGQYLSSALLGLFNPFLYYLILLKAYSVLPAQVAQPLNMIWPIVLVFLSVPLLGQKIAPRSFVALFICFAGVFLISSQGKVWNIRSSDPLGVALATGSSVIWSLYWVFNMRDKRDEETKLFLNFFFATLFILFLNLLMGRLRVPSLVHILPAVYVGLFEMGFAFLLWMKALRLSRSTDYISTLVYLAPFLSLVFVHRFIGEHIYWTTVIGLVLIVTGILYQKFPYNRQKN